MNWEYFVAKKVATEGEQSFARLIIRIAIAAVALSVTVMICTTALISGFKKEISSKIFDFWGHIHITDTNVYQSFLDAYPITDKQAFYPYLDTIGKIEFTQSSKFLGRTFERKKRTKGGIRSIQTFALKAGIIKSREEIEGILLKGIGSDFDWTYMNQYLVEGDTLNLGSEEPEEGIILSRQTADRLKLTIGDRFNIHFVEKGQQPVRRFEVKGIYKTGLEEYDQKFALIDIRKLQQLMGWREDQIAGFELFLDDIDDMAVFREYIYFEELPPDLWAETIRDKIPEIFEWLSLQDVNQMVILILMIIVAVINMITAVLILILERTFMIGTLKSLGAGDWSIRKLFLYYAAYIIGLGLFWGNLIGIGLCLAQDTFGFIRLDEVNYYLNVAPVDLEPFTILLLNLGTLVITLICLILPSYLVTTVSPIKAIRFR